MLNGIIALITEIAASPTIRVASLAQMAQRAVGAVKGIRDELLLEKLEIFILELQYLTLFEEGHEKFRQLLEKYDKQPDELYRFLAIVIDRLDRQQVKLSCTAFQRNA